MFNNYKYFTDGKSIVIAVSTYAGKKVRGIAKCNPEDKFNLEDGKALAAARCNLKVAKLRNKRARQKYNQKAIELQKVDKDFHNTCDYLRDSAIALGNAQAYVDKLTSQF